MYILIDPYTNKPMYFSTFANEEQLVVRTFIDANGNTQVQKQPAYCVEVEYDSELLNKTYDFSTKTFS
jgi:hypothetical protein